MRTPALVTTILCLTLLLARGAEPPNGPLERAALAWDAGDYVSALTAYLQILDSRPDEAAIETIALQTGELFATRELTTDGDAPRFSPDGRFLVYETGGAPDRRTFLFTGDGTTQVTEFVGFRAAFSHDSAKLAYLKVVPSPTLRDAFAAIAAAPPNERVQRTVAFNAAVAREARVIVRNLRTEGESEIPTGDLRKTAVAFGAGDVVIVSASRAEEPTQIYSIGAGREPAALTTGPGDKTVTDVNAFGTVALYSVRTGGGGRGGAGGGGRGQAPSTGSGQALAPMTFGVLLLPEGRSISVTGSAPSFSADGRSLVYIRRDRDASQIVVAAATSPLDATVVRSGAERIDGPALSPDGSRVVFQMMPKEDWEVFVASRDGKTETRVTREIQHDILQRFLTGDVLLATIGEARHRR